MQNRTYGQAVFFYRKGLGLTQTEMAEKLDLSLRYYQRLEADENEPSLSTLKNTLMFLKVSYEELFSQPPPPQKTRNVYQMRPDPKAALAMQEAQQVLSELAAAPPLLRLSAIFLLTGDEEILKRILDLPGGERRAQILGKLRAVP